MKHKKTKLLSILLAIVMMVGLLPATAFAAGEYVLEGVTIERSGTSKSDGVYWLSGGSYTENWKYDRKPSNSNYYSIETRIFTNEALTTELSEAPSPGTDYYVGYGFRNTLSGDHSIDFSQLTKENCILKITGYVVECVKITPDVYDGKDRIDIVFKFRKPKTYTATFNPGEGKGTEFTQTVTEGEKLTLPKCNFTAPAEGWEFDRWSIGETGQPGEEVEISEDKTITALWKPKMFTITYNLNGGTAGEGFRPTRVFPYGAEFPITPVPSHFATPPAGKMFTGVKIDGKFYPVGSEYKVTKNVTVILQWAEAEISEVSVTFPTPKAGDKASDFDYSKIKVPAGANYGIIQILFWDADGEEFTGTFEKGKKYFAFIALGTMKPFYFKGGMEIWGPETPAPAIKDRVKFMVNGKDITENEKAPYSMSSVRAVYEFTIGSGGSGGSGGGGGGGSVSYAITAQKSENGTVELSKTRAAKDTKVTVTPQPDAGYETDKITVTDKDGKEVPVTKNSDGTYSFTMPSGQVTVASAFKKADGTTEPENPDEEAPLLVVTINSMTYRLNGKTMTMDSAPFIDGNNRTMLPVRVIANALGISNENIKWDSATKTASFTRADGKVVSCTVNSNVIKVGDESVTIDTVPVIRNDRIYLPMRALFNAFDVPDENILWDAAARTVTVTKKD